MSKRRRASPDRRATQGDYYRPGPRIKLDDDSDGPAFPLPGPSRAPRGGISRPSVSPTATISPAPARRILPLPSIPPRNRNATYDRDNVVARAINPILAATTEDICPDGDIILNFRYCQSQSLIQDLESGSGTEGKGFALLPPWPVTRMRHIALSEPSLRLRVSSSVISIASPPLKMLVSDSISAALHHDHPLVMIRSPRVWGFRESASEATIILNSDQCTLNSVEHALKILFLILHFRTTSLHRAPEVTTTVRVAELAWVFDCVAPILPWMQVWIRNHRMAEMWARSIDVESQPRVNPASNNTIGLIPQVSMPQFAGRWMVVSWAVGDAKAFERSSRDYIYLYFQPRDSQRGVPGNEHSLSDLGVVARLYKDLCAARAEFVRGIYVVLNDTFTESCSKAAGHEAGAAAARSAAPGSGVLPVHVHSLMLGSLVQSVMNIWGTNFPLEPTWNLPIKSLWERVEQVARVLEQALLPLQQRGNLPNNPISRFKTRMHDVLWKLKGLQLKNYRPQGKQLMDFHSGVLM